MWLEHFLEKILVMKFNSLLNTRDSFYSLYITDLFYSSWQSYEVSHTDTLYFRKKEPSYTVS